MTSTWTISSGNIVSIPFMAENGVTVVLQHPPVNNAVMVVSDISSTYLTANTDGVYTALSQFKGSLNLATGPLDQMGIIAVDSGVTRINSLTADSLAIDSAISRIQLGVDDGHKILNGISQAVSAVSSSSANRVVIAFASGPDSGSVANVDDIIATAKYADVEIHVITFGDAGAPEYIQLATETDGSVTDVPAPSGMAPAMSGSLPDVKPGTILQDVSSMPGGTPRTVTTTYQSGGIVETTEQVIQ